MTHYFFSIRMTCHTINSHANSYMLTNSKQVIFEIQTSQRQLYHGLCPILKNCSIQHVYQPLSQLKRVQPVTLRLAWYHYTYISPTELWLPVFLFFPPSHSSQTIYALIFVFYKVCYYEYIQHIQIECSLAQPAGAGYARLDRMSVRSCISQLTIHHMLTQNIRIRDINPSTQAEGITV